jgi:hypothetical protein
MLKKLNAILLTAFVACLNGCATTEPSSQHSGFKLPSEFVSIEIAPAANGNPPVKLDAASFNMLINDRWSKESVRVFELSNLPAQHKYWALLVRTIMSTQSQECIKLKLASTTATDHSAAQSSSSHGSSKCKQTEIWKIEACSITENWKVDSCGSFDRLETQSR